MAATFDMSLPTTPSREWLGNVTASPTREDQTASKETPRSPPPPTTPSSLGLDISGSFSENFGSSAQQPESLTSLVPSQDELQRVLDLVKQYLPAQVSTILETSDSDSQNAEVNDHVDSPPSHLPEASTATMRQKPPPASGRSLSGLSTAANDGFLTSTPGRSGNSSTAGTPDIEKATIILAFPSTIERRFTDLYASDRATDGHGASSERGTTGTSSLGRATTIANTTTSGGHTDSTSAGHTTSTNGLSHHADDGHSVSSDGPIAQDDGHAGRIPLYDVHRPAKKGTTSTWLSSRERVDSPLASSLYADAGHSTLSGDGVPSGAWKPAFGPRTSSMLGVLSRSTSGYIDSPAQGTSIEGHVGHSSASPSTPAARSVDAQSSLPMSTAADAGHSSYGFDDGLADDERDYSLTSDAVVGSLAEHGHENHAHDDTRQDDASWRTLAAGHAHGDTHAFGDGRMHIDDGVDHTPPTVRHHRECPVKQRLEARHHREDGLGTHPKELSAMQQDEDAEEHARHAKEPFAPKDNSPTARVRFSDRLRGEAKILTGKLVRKEGRVEEGRRMMGRA